MTEFTDVGALADIPPRGARVVRTRAGCVALFRTHDDRVFALEDRCPHRGGPLSEGIVSDRSVTCPLHNRVVSLETGATDEPGEAAVPTWEVRVEGGRLLLAGARAARAAA
jgi:nitrite reductase (NADH) small subunit